MCVTGYRYWALGSLYAQFGQIDTAIDCYRSALYAFRQTRDALNMGKMLNRLGELHALRGEERETQVLCQAAARTFGKLDKPTEAIAALRNVAMVHYHQDRTLLALKLLEKVLIYCDTAGDTFNEAITLTCMAQVYTARQQYLFALACDEAALEVFQAANHFSQIKDATYRAAQALFHMGEICAITQHLDVAIQRNLQALALFEAISCTEGISLVLKQLGLLHEQQGNICLALHYYQQVVELSASAAPH